MSMDKLRDNLRDIGAAIEVCIEKKLLKPALILLYSGMDMVGWLNSHDEYATKTSFMGWVDEYLLKTGSIQCTSIDLYAARCGLLHTCTPESSLCAQGEARKVNYAWGTGKAENLISAIQRNGETHKQTAVHIDELYKTWQSGVARFIEDLENNPERKSLVQRKAKKLFNETGHPLRSQVFIGVAEKSSRNPDDQP